MRRLLTAFVILCLPLFVQGQTARTPATVPAPTTRVQTPAGPRIHLPLDSDWRFHQGDIPEWLVMVGDDAAWQTVNVPHTWNAVDGEDGGNNYWKGACWYRKNITLTPAMKGKSLFLRFEGANRRTRAYVNGQPVGTHLGGFGAFCFDVTSAMKPGDNIVAVNVSNAPDADSPPLSADFTFFGGLYRPVELLALDAIHISPLDYASPGVTIETPEVSEKSATMRVRTLVSFAAEPVPPSPAVPAATMAVRGAARAATTARRPEKPPAVKNILVRVRITDDAGSVQTLAPLAIAAGKTGEVLSTLTLNRPHLWDGRHDPHMYQVQVTLLQNGAVLDEVTQPLGLRTFSVDPAKGFLLNGKPYDLHGVNRHQDRQDKGWAISQADQDQDMALISEMGCTAVRLAHYQQSDYFYGLCDKAGIIVWAEACLVNDITPGAAFARNCDEQLRDLIRQSRNHPSICFWSLSNEIFAKNDARPLLGELNQLAHHEDPSRLTTMAFRPGARWDNITDVTGENRYFGWYNGILADFAPWVATQPPLVAVSEYGAGASIHFHSETPARMDHSEEYQCLYHETYWNVLKNNPQIWGKFVWCMFDFASDGRAEGDHAGINDKGLISYDRKVKKDAFYFYKANWSEEPTVYIAGRRFTTRGKDSIPIKIYSNTLEVTLRVNGQDVGKKAPVNGTILWENVTLKQGENDVRATARFSKGAPITDSCSWTYTPGAPDHVFEPQDEAMRAAILRRPPRPAPAR